MSCCLILDFTVRRKRFKIMKQKKNVSVLIKNKVFGTIITKNALKLWYTDNFNFRYLLVFKK